MNEDDWGHMLDAVEGRFWGKYRGSVVQNRDEEGRGRLQVKVPAVLGEVAVWALPCVPYAGPSVGFYALPPVESNVWVEFEGGDPSYPIWVGCFWRENDIAQNDRDPNIKFWRSGKVSLRIDDGEGLIEITTQGGGTLRIRGSEITFEGQKIEQRASGKKTALTPSSFDVHDGAFTVV